MSEPASSSSGAYGEGVKWILTIAATAIAGAFSHLKEIQAEGRAVQALITLALVAFVVCVWAGMNYLFWLNLIPLRKERIEESRSELAEADDQAESESKRRSDLQKKIDSDVHNLDDAERTMPTWYRIFTYAFTGALALATLGIFTSLAMRGFTAQDQKQGGRKVACSHTGINSPTVSRDRFHIVYSAVHSTIHGKEAHTFLLDDQTGELWQMICQDNIRVTFRKVARIP